VMVGLHQTLLDPQLVARVIDAGKRGARLAAEVGAPGRSPRQLVTDPRFDWGHVHPFGGIALLGRYRAIWGLAGVVLLLHLAHYVYPSVFVLFADYSFGWGTEMVGNVLGVVGVLSVLVNVVVVKKAVAKFGERRSLLIGLACGVCGFTIYGFAPTGAWFLAGLPIMSLWALAMPSTQSLVTRQVGPEVQGRVQGALTSLASLAGIIGPVLYTSVFATFIGDHAPMRLPGAPFLVAAVLLATAGLVAWRYARVPKEAQAPAMEPTPPTVVVD